MKIEYKGTFYHVWRFTSADPAGTGISVHDITSNTTILEIFSNEEDKEILFNAREFQVSLHLVEKVISLFDQEIGRPVVTQVNGHP